MKRFTSIKTRITIWYTLLMFILVSVVLVLVGTLSYQLSIDNIENDVKIQVRQDVCDGQRSTGMAASRAVHALDYIDADIIRNTLEG